MPSITKKQVEVYSINLTRQELNNLDLLISLSDVVGTSEERDTRTMSKSISKTNKIRSNIKERFFTPLHWIAQDKTGEIYIFRCRPSLGKLFSDEWLPSNKSMAVQFLGKTIKTKCNKTYIQACAQLTIDNWWLDRYGRLIVEDRNTPNLLKEQA